MEARKIKCQNCCQLICQSNLTSHEAYCFRNIKQCLVCLQFLEITKLQTHELSHKVKICEKCNQSFQISHSDRHNLLCEKRLEYCVYCDKQIIATEFKVHRQTCQNKTRKCHACQQDIRLIEYVNHINNCNSIKTEKQKFRIPSIKASLSQKFIKRRNQMNDKQELNKDQKQSTSIEKECRIKTENPPAVRFPKQVNFTAQNNYLYARRNDYPAQQFNFIIRKESTQSKKTFEGSIPFLKSSSKLEDVSLVCGAATVLDTNFFSNFQRLIDDSVHIAF